MGVRAGVQNTTAVPPRAAVFCETWPTQVAIWLTRAETWPARPRRWPTSPTRNSASRSTLLPSGFAIRPTWNPNAPGSPYGRPTLRPVGELRVWSADFPGRPTSGPGSVEFGPVGRSSGQGARNADPGLTSCLVASPKCGLGRRQVGSGRPGSQVAPLHGAQLRQAQLLQVRSNRSALFESPRSGAARALHGPAEASRGRRVGFVQTPLASSRAPLARARR